MDKTQEKLVVALDKATCEMRYRVTEMRDVASTLNARANAAEDEVVRASKMLSDLIKEIGSVTVGDGAALEIRKALIEEQFVMLRVLNGGKCTPVQGDILSSEVSGIGKAIVIVNDVLVKYGIKVD